MTVAAASPAHEKAKILLVDDRPENLLALRAVLDRPDYELVSASSGEEALERVLHDDFAVILMDVAMPKLDGFETATLIRQRAKARRIPIIFVTAIMQEVAHVFRGYEVGAVDYLLKPFDVHALLAKVSVFVELHRQAREIERKERALHEAERREREQLESLYDVTFEEAPIGIAHLSAEGRLLRLNRRLAEILGRPRERLLGARIDEFVYPQDRAIVVECVRNLVAGRECAAHPGRKHGGEIRFLHANQSLVWTAITMSLLTVRTGRPVQLILLEDVTEARRLAESLRASEARFDRLRQTGLLGVLFEDADGTISDANDTFLRMIGYAPDDMRARRINMRELTPPEYDEAEGRARAELGAKGVCRTYEKELIRKDGSRTSVLVGAARLDGPERGIVAFALDITERKQVERERARVLRELRDGVRARDDFLSIAAHELKNPLTPLVLQITNLLALAQSHRVPAEPAWLVKQLEPVERATRRFEHLVDTLLDVSRVTVAKLQLELEDVDLAALTRESLERMRHEIERSGSQVTLEAPAPVVGKWDRLRLEQVIDNLLSNAVKYGQGKPIEIAVRRDGEAARLSVRDHGIGIAIEDQPRLFERFERLVPVRHYGGFGVGLWLVRQIAQAHGGKVDVWSRPGEGAQFTVELPLRAPA